MRNSRTITAVAAAAGMLLLILDGKTAITSASEGLQLCIRSVIPSLFPFFVLSGLLTGALFGSRGRILQPLGQLFCIPKGAESLLLTGFLGGYPVGAQCIASVWRSGQLSREQAERMLAFCNNAGPSFLFGIIAPMFSNPMIPWLLWMIHIASAFLVSLCLPSREETVTLRKDSPPSLFDALNKALRVMASVCGWVILFRIGIAFLNRWLLWILPTQWQVVVTGILELTNGCCSLSSVTDENLRFLICSGMLAFGGICVAMQTMSVTSGLSLKMYFPGKILQAGFSILLSWALLPKGTISPAVPAVSLGISALFAASLRKIQKRSSNPQILGV